MEIYYFLTFSNPCLCYIKYYVQLFSEIAVYYPYFMKGKTEIQNGNLNKEVQGFSQNCFPTQYGKGNKRNLWVNASNSTASVSIIATQQKLSIYTPPIAPSQD